MKSLDEVFREELAAANPEEAHRVLMAHRKQATAVDGDFILIEGHKRRCEFSRGKQEFVEAVRKIVYAYRTHWPITDRFLHYKLLCDPPIVGATIRSVRYANDLRSYKSLTDLCLRMRLAGVIPHHAIHDPTRPVRLHKFPRDVGTFIASELDGFLKHYCRNYQQSQPNHIEIVSEKETIESFLRPVAEAYCLPLTTRRGYSSLSPRHNMAMRFRSSKKKHLLVLMLSDFDPEGEDIVHSFARSMRDDFGVGDVKVQKLALTEEQVEEFQLQPQMKAKAGSSRRARFVEEHGDDVYELDALEPAELQQILRDGIDAVLDVNAFNAEVDAEKNEAAALDVMRRQLRKVIQEFGVVANLGAQQHTDADAGNEN